MWPPGHLAVGYLCYHLYSRQFEGQYPDASAVVVVIFASLLPDLIDKPLAWYVGVLPSGRTLGHSLLFAVPCLVVVGLFFRRRGRGELGVAFALGLLSHQFVDVLPTLWNPEAQASSLLWPIYSVEPDPEGGPDVVEMLSQQLTQPYFLLEFVLLALALLYWRRAGYPGVRTTRRWLGRGQTLLPFQ